MSKVPDKSDAVCGNDGITYSNQVRIFGFFFGFFGFLDLCHQKYDFYSYQLGLLAVKA